MGTPWLLRSSSLDVVVIIDSIFFYGFQQSDWVYKLTQPLVAQLLFGMWNVIGRGSSSSVTGGGLHHGKLWTEKVLKE